MSNPVPTEQPPAREGSDVAEPPTPVTAADRRAIPMMAIGHATVDFYQGVVPCLVPFLVHVTLGQDYLPNRVGTASGVTLGLAVSIGGVATPAIGALAELTTLRVALTPLIALCALAWFLSRSLTDPQSPAPRSVPTSVGKE